MSQVDVTKVEVKDIRKGDRFRTVEGSGWDAMDDARIERGGGVSVAVRYVPDGGTGRRGWDEPDFQIEVTR